MTTNISATQLADFDETLQQIKNLLLFFYPVLNSSENGLNVNAKDLSGNELFTPENPGAVRITNASEVSKVQMNSCYPLGAIPFIITATGSANAEVSATVSAATGKAHYVCGYLAVIRGAAAGNDLAITVKDGMAVRLTDVIGNGAASGSKAETVSGFIPLLAGTVNTDLVLTAAAGGNNVITEITIWGYTL